MRITTSGRFRIDGLGLAQHLEHRCGGRPQPAPELERLGCLLHQHPPTLHGARAAVLERPAYERRVAFAVSHVITDRLRAENRRGDGRDLAAQAGGGGVDEEIECAAGDVLQANSDDDT